MLWLILCMWWCFGLSYVFHVYLFVCDIDTLWLAPERIKLFFVMRVTTYDSFFVLGLSMERKSNPPP